MVLVPTTTSPSPLTPEAPEKLSPGITPRSAMPPATVQRKACWFPPLTPDPPTTTVPLASTAAPWEEPLATSEPRSDMPTPHTWRKARTTPGLLVQLQP